MRQDRRYFAENQASVAGRRAGSARQNDRRGGTPHVSGQTSEGRVARKESRAKSAGIILRIWSGIPPERVSLRDRAVASSPELPARNASGCIGA